MEARPRTGPPGRRASLRNQSKGDKQRRQRSSKANPFRKPKLKKPYGCYFCYLEQLQREYDEQEEQRQELEAKQETKEYWAAFEARRGVSKRRDSLVLDALMKSAALEPQAQGWEQDQGEGEEEEHEEVTNNQGTESTESPTAEFEAQKRAISSTGGQGPLTSRTIRNGSRKSMVDTYSFSSRRSAIKDEEPELPTKASPWAIPSRHGLPPSRQSDGSKETRRSLSRPRTVAFARSMHDMSGGFSNPLDMDRLHSEASHLGHVHGDPLIFTALWRLHTQGKLNGEHVRAVASAIDSDGHLNLSKTELEDLDEALRWASMNSTELKTHAEIPDISVSSDSDSEGESLQNTQLRRMQEYEEALKEDIGAFLSHGDDSKDDDTQEGIDESNQKPGEPAAVPLKRAATVRLPKARHAPRRRSTRRASSFRLPRAVYEPTTAFVLEATDGDGHSADDGRNQSHRLIPLPSFAEAHKSPLRPKPEQAQPRTKATPPSQRRSKDHGHHHGGASPSFRIAPSQPSRPASFSVKPRTSEIIPVLSQPSTPGWSQHSMELIPAELDFLNTSMVTEAPSANSSLEEAGRLVGSTKSQFGTLPSPKMSFITFPDDLVEEPDAFEEHEPKQGKSEVETKSSYPSSPGSSAYYLGATELSSSEEELVGVVCRCFGLADYEVTQFTSRIQELPRKGNMRSKVLMMCWKAGRVYCQYQNIHTSLTRSEDNQALLDTLLPELERISIAMDNIVFEVLGYDVDLRPFLVSRLEALAWPPQPKVTTPGRHAHPNQSADSGLYVSPVPPPSRGVGERRQRTMKPGPRPPTTPRRPSSRAKTAAVSAKHRRVLAAPPALAVHTPRHRKSFLVSPVTAASPAPTPRPRTNLPYVIPVSPCRCNTPEAQPLGGRSVHSSSPRTVSGGRPRSPRGIAIEAAACMQVDVTVHYDVAQECY